MSESYNFWKVIVGLLLVWLYEILSEAVNKSCLEGFKFRCDCLESSLNLFVSLFIAMFDDLKTERLLSVVVGAIENLADSEIEGVEVEKCADVIEEVSGSVLPPEIQVRARKSDQYSASYGLRTVSESHPQKESNSFADASKSSVIGKMGSESSL